MATSLHLVGLALMIGHGPDDLWQVQGSEHLRQTVRKECKHWREGFSSGPIPGSVQFAP